MLLPATARAQGDISDMIAERGLVATEAHLAALAEPTPTDLFALGGVRFLAAIEASLQARWRLGLNTERTELPMLRLPIPPNPDPEPFEGAAIEAMFADLARAMVRARKPLVAIADDDAVDLPIDLLDIWFDIDGDGARGDGESLAEVAGIALTGRPLRIVAEDTGDGAMGPVLHFDTADAAWLAAYTHFLAAASDMVLAFRPAGPIDRVLAARAKMEALAPDSEFTNAFDLQFGQTADRLGMIYFSLRQQPDAERSRAARQNLLQMIRQNRLFWTRVAAETDNRGEWLPNDAQQSGLGLAIPAGTGPRWLAVLDDIEALLEGRLLIGHWRLREGAGINLARLMDDPVPVDIAGWVHGIDLLPYAEEGQRIGPQSWRAFEQIAGGDALMMVLFLN